MQIILLRHGETEWNIQGRKQGHGDSPLTDPGRDNARRLSQQMATDIDRAEPWSIVCSPSGRAVATAQIVGDAIGLDPSSFVHTPALMEADHGDWEGLTNADIDNRYPGQRKARLKDYWNYRMPEGESYSDLFARAGNWMTTLQPTERLIVVTHAMTSRCLRGYYLALGAQACLDLPHHDHDLYFSLTDGRVIQHRLRES